MRILPGTKRALAALLIAALLLPAFFGGAPRAQAAAEADVRYVRVLLSTEGVSTLRIPVSGTYTLLESQRSFAGGTLTVSASGSQITVSHSKEGELYVGTQASVERMELGRDKGALTIKTVAGNRNFLGHFTFTAAGGAVRVVNRVPLSHYLYGVVGYEMSNDFPVEALKAQAMAAKGYVLLHMGGRSYDVVDTTDDQVYKGYEPAYTNVISAVDGTMTDVLYYNNKPLLCYYAASNGGWMILPSVRWGGKEYDGAYASGEDAYDVRNADASQEKVFIPTAYSEKALGTRAFMFIDQRLSSVIGQAGFLPQDFRFGGVQSIDSVTSFGEAGFKGDLNHTSVELKASVIAQRDPQTVPSPTPEITPNPTPTPEITPTPSPTPAFVLPTPTPEIVPPQEGEEGYEGYESPSPTPEILEPTPTPAWDPLPTPTPAWDPTPSPTPSPEMERVLSAKITFTFDEITDAALFYRKNLSIRYARNAEGGFYLVHARYGHGAGMSQRGAEQMAREGHGFREILGFYYPGATLGTMSYTFPEQVAASQPQQPSAGAPGSAAAGTASTSPSSGVVQRGTVNLRAAASTKSSSVEKLPEGTALTLLGMQGNWYYVSAPSGNTGFVRYDYVLLNGANLIARGKVTASAVNYRTGPDKSYDAVGKLSRDTAVGIYGMVDGWYKIMAINTGMVGFISGDYVTITEGVADAPAANTATPAAEATAAPSALPEGVTPSPVVIGSTPSPTPSPIPTLKPTPLYAAAGKISGQGVNLREGPSTGTKSYGKLDRNTPVSLSEKSGSWYKLTVSSTGAQGYVYDKYVAVVEAAESDATVSSSTAGYVNASGVRVRSGPGTGYDSVGRLSRNTTLVILGSTGSWQHVRVKANDTEGYIFGKYVTIARVSAVSGGADARGTIVASRLNLRDRAGTAGSKVLTTMSRGDIVTVLDPAVNGWIRVSLNGTEGYCAARYLRVG